MNYYQEITLLPDPEISLGFIWQKVFQQVHIALVDNKVADNQSAIAIGFPQYGQAKFPLGFKLRLFANEQTQLEQLNISKWLSQLEDYAHVKGIKPVPDKVSYVSFSRKHIKTLGRIEEDMRSKAKLWAEKSGKSLEICLVEMAESRPVVNPDGLPFIFIYSQETKRRSPNNNGKFPLFIQMEQVDKQQLGVFDCYGLSAKTNVQGNKGTIPQF